MSDVNAIDEMYDAVKNKPPGVAFTAVYAAAPAQLREFLDAKVAEIIFVEMPKLSLCLEQGPTVLRKDMITCRDVFDGALKYASKAEAALMNDITATIRDASLDIADSIDRAIRRVLLDDPDCNRFAMYDMQSHHARLVKCLTDIALSADDRKAIAEAQSAQPD